GRRERLGRPCVLVRLFGADRHGGQEYGGDCDCGYEKLPSGGHGVLSFSADLSFACCRLCDSKRECDGPKCFSTLPESFRYSDSIQNAAEELFRANLALVERVIAGVCRRAGLRGPDAEDFGSIVMVALIENDYAILRG